MLLIKGVQTFMAWQDQFKEVFDEFGVKESKVFYEKRKSRSFLATAYVDSTTEVAGKLEDVLKSKFWRAYPYSNDRMEGFSPLSELDEDKKKYTIFIKSSPETILELRDNLDKKKLEQYIDEGIMVFEAIPAKDKNGRENLDAGSTLLHHAVANGKFEEASMIIEAFIKHTLATNGIIGFNERMKKFVNLYDKTSNVTPLCLAMQYLGSKQRGCVNVKDKNELDIYSKPLSDVMEVIQYLVVCGAELTKEYRQTNQTPIDCLIDALSAFTSVKKLESFAEEAQKEARHRMMIIIKLFKDKDVFLTTDHKKQLKDKGYSDVVATLEEMEYDFQKPTPKLTQPTVSAAASLQAKFETALTAIDEKTKDMTPTELKELLAMLNKNISAKIAQTDSKHLSTPEEKSR